MCVCSMLLVQYVKNMTINMNKCTSFVWRPYLTVQFQSDLFLKKQWHKILLEIICKLCSSPSSFLKLVCPFYSWLCCILAAVGDVLAAVWCNHSPPPGTKIRESRCLINHLLQARKKTVISKTNQQSQWIVPYITQICVCV